MDAAKSSNEGTRNPIYDQSAQKEKRKRRNHINSESKKKSRINSLGKELCGCLRAKHVM